MKKRSAVRWPLLFIPAVMLFGTVIGVLVYALHLFPIPSILQNFNFLCVPVATAGLGFDNDFGWPAWPFALAALLMSALYLLCWLRDWRKVTLGLFIADALVSIGLGAAFMSRANPLVMMFWIPVIYHAVGFVLLGLGMKRIKH